MPKQLVSSLVRLGAVALAGSVVLAWAPATPAQEVTARTLVDRAQIQDLITRYYYNFGRDNSGSFANFYAEDAELILGSTHFKGRDGITKAYAGAEKNSPMRKAYAFNVTISNPLITVHGSAATAQLIFTEYLTGKRGDAPVIRTQGREYATFIKEHGQWRYKTRQIMSGAEAPAGWGN